MRRTRKSRASGREQAVNELFGTRGLEADPVSREPDDDFPLRPFATEVPPDELVDTRPASNESDIERLLRRAEEAASRGRNTEAVNRFREALSHDPKHAGARRTIALLLEAQGDPEQAIAELTTGLRLAPDHPVLLVTRGAIHGRERMFTESEADLRRAIRLDPRLLEAHLTLGLVLQRKGLPGDAAEALRRAAELAPDNPQVLYPLGETLHQSGAQPEAKAVLERLIGLQPGDPRTHHLLGRVFDRMGRWEEAQAMYRVARELAPQ